MTVAKTQTTLSVEAGTREFQSYDFVIDFHQHLTKKWTVSSWSTYATASATETVFSNMFLSLNYINYRITEDVIMSAGYRFEQNFTYDYHLYTPVAKIRWRIL